jgi:hypothetical protein
MSEEIVKRCDFKVGRGRNIKAHGEIVDESTRFRIDGREYVVDLCDEHKGSLAECLNPFVEISRRAGTALPRNARGRAVMRAKGGVTFTTKDVREWLQGQNVPVSESGRVPNALIDQYKEAHGLA